MCSAEPRDNGRLVGTPPDTFAPRAALGQAGLLALQRGSDVLRVVAFAAIVPRVVGPEVFGQYSLVMSIATWFALLSGFGATQIMTFFVPPLLRGEDRAAVERLLGGFLVLRLGSGSLAALTFFALTALWLRDVDPVALGLAAASVVLRTVANLLFAFRLGLGDAAGWGTGDISRQWIVLTLMLPGAIFFGLRGTLGAVLIAEVVLVAAGAARSRGHLRPELLRFDRREMAPYLRFNLHFLAGNVIFAACQRGGEPLLRAAGGHYAEIGIFAAAYAVQQFASRGFRHVCTGMGPFFSALRAEGRLAELGEWAGRLAATLALLGVFAALAVAALGPHILPLVLGAPYAAAAVVLVPLALGLPLVALSALGRVLAVTFDRPGATFVAATAQAVALIAAGSVLIPREGLLGAGLAILASAAVHAVSLVWGLRARFHLPLRNWALVVVPGLAAAVPFLCFAGSWSQDAAWLALALTLYAAGLRAAGLFAPQALGAAVALLRQPAPRTPAPRTP